MTKQQPPVNSLVEDAEDHEIFEIQDYTTACEWERFIVQIEETINEWKLNSASGHSQDQTLDMNVILVIIFLKLKFIAQ